MPIPSSQRARPAAAIRSLPAREGPAFPKERRSCSPSPQAPHPFPSALFQRGHRPCGQGPYGPKKAEKARFFRFLRAGRRRCASALLFERMIRCDSLPRQHKMKISRNLPEAPRFPHAFFLLPKKSRPRLRERGGDFFQEKIFSCFAQFSVRPFCMIRTAQQRILQLLYIFTIVVVSFYRKILDKLKSVDVCARAFSALGFLQSLSPISRTSVFRVLRRRSLQARAA